MPLGFLNELGLQVHRANTIYFANNFVTIDCFNDAYVFHFCAHFDCGAGALYLEIFNDSNGIARGKRGSISILNRAPVDMRLMDRFFFCVGTPLMFTFGADPKPPVCIDIFASALRAFCFSGHGTQDSNGFETRPLRPALIGTKNHI